MSIGHHVHVKARRGTFCSGPLRHAANVFCATMQRRCKIFTSTAVLNKIVVDAATFRASVMCGATSRCRTGSRMSMRSGLTQLCVAVLLVASARGVRGADASTTAWENTPYPYSVVSENVQDVLRNFGYNAEVRVMVAPGVTGVVQGRSGDGTARQFLDDVTKANDLDWYSDGTVVYVSSSSDEQTAIVPLMLSSGCRSRSAATRQSSRVRRVSLPS